MLRAKQAPEPTVVELRAAVMEVIEPKALRKGELTAAIGHIRNDLCLGVLVCLPLL
jgi:hypothetical protein